MRTCDLLDKIMHEFNKVSSIRYVDIRILLGKYLDDKIIINRTIIEDILDDMEKNVQLWSDTIPAQNIRKNVKHILDNY